MPDLRTWPWSGRTAHPQPSDGGTILILTLGYLMVAAMLVVVVTDVSAVYLARRSVASAADGAALAAAQQIDENAVYTATGSLDRLPLNDIDATVQQYQRQADPSGRTSLAADLVDATTVQVEGTRTVDLPVVGMLGIGPVTVRAGAQAQSVVRRPGAP
ncbi:pilus assembly protein TadG-related protein [Frankia sp. R82]|uniref:pilus assembly protein TadG-related protein n=1 Tax=Frankia sp. R82 TaxID=2950553 RepID=UPI0020444338|nr:pilus assembly protein TadG-related protein [Frankia sp. R82]MCM3886738.1 pilus assembly protein TadG-related protein [Frankia sp. R82]